MSIRKNPNRKSNPWECRWTEEGKHHSRSFHTRKEAEQFDAERKTNLQNGSGFRTSDEKLTMDDYAQKFLSQDKRASTVKRNHGIYRLHIEPRLGGRKIRSIRTTDVQELTNEWISNGLQPRTIRRHLAVLSGIFALAESDGVLQRIPTKGVKVPTPSRPHRYAMSIEEVTRLRMAINPNYEAFVYTLIETGMRIGEAIRLNIEDFDWKNGTLSIGESKTEAGIRTVWITPAAQSLISAHIRSTGRTMANKSEPLFVSHKTDVDTGLVVGARINYSNFRSRIFKPAAKQIGLAELQLHDFRRTAGTIYVNANIHQKVTQEQFGHADIRTTLNLYAQATDEARQESVRRIEEILNPEPQRLEMEA